MKKIITACLTWFLIGNIQAQVKIGGNPTIPAASSILELDGGSTRGLLLPRMRKMDMLAIPNPAEGLTLYITDEQATYLRRQSNWVKLSGGADAFTLPYTGSFGTAGPILSLSQFNSESGSVAKFQITDAASTGNVLEVTSNASGYSPTDANGGFFKITNPNSVGAAVKGEINSQFSNLTSAGVLGLATGDGGFAGVFRATKTSGLGVGVYAYSSTNGNAIMANAAQGNGHGIEAIAGDQGRCIYAWKGVNAGGTVAQFTTYSPTNTLPIIRIHNESTGNAIQVDGLNPQIQLNQIVGNMDVAKGFIQLNDDDLRLGTVASNGDGQIIFRNSGADRVTINSLGNMLVGGSIAPAGGHKIAVKGAIAATAFNVVAIGSWPDYVFAKNYKLQSLEEIETFINANKHLPNIPSAAEIEKNGLELGDMQKRMMEKIEELTLHLIEADKRIKAADKKAEELSQQLNKLSLK